MPWTDENGQPVTDGMILQSLGTPASAAPSGQWMDENGKAVTDPMILKSLGTPNAAPKSQESTLGYIAKTTANAPIQEGENLWKADIQDSPFSYNATGGGLTPQAQTELNRPSAAFPVGPAPNKVAQYGGAVGSAFSANPVLGMIAPGYTAAGAIGGEAGSDVNSLTGSHVPDWAARGLGALASGGVWSGVKAAGQGVINAATGTDAAMENAANIKARIQSGEGRMGQFQQQAQQTADSLDKASSAMPVVEPTTPVPLTNTTKVLNDPTTLLPADAKSLQAMVNTNQGSLPYSAIKPLQDQFPNNPQIYRALLSDRRAAVVAANGEDAGAAFDQANLARRAQFLLQNSKDPQGFYNPLALTRTMAKDPLTNEVLADATPQMSELTDKASNLYDLVSPMMKANTPRPGVIPKLAAAGASMGIGHLTGQPEIGALMAAGMLTRPQYGNVNLLYQLPRNYGSPFGSPTSWNALLNASQSPQGLLGTSK